jgi:hypothetical protein
MLGKRLISFETDNLPFGTALYSLARTEKILINAEFLERDCGRCEDSEDTIFISLNLNDVTIRQTLAFIRGDETAHIFCSNLG